MNTVGIKHLIDIDTPQFIGIVRGLGDYTASEKYDGANLWFGIDGGEVYVSREGKNKSAQKIFTPGNFEDVAANDQFKAALIALGTVKTKLSNILEQTDIVECEVIFGKQPNVVTYADDDSESKLVLLRMVSGDSEKLSNVYDVLQNVVVPVELQVKHSTDGKALLDDTLKTEFSFGIATQTKIDPKVSSDGVLQAGINELEKYNTSNSTIIASAQTDEQTITKKAEVQFRLSSIKQRIIDRLLLLLDSSPTGEGIVITNQKTGDVYKLVNKSKFGRINEFYQKGRKTAIGTILTTDRSADFFKRGGIVGDTKIQLASVLGFPDFARAQTVRKSLAELGEVDFINQFQINDVQGIKNKLLAIVNVGISSLMDALAKFNNTNGGSINVNGEQISYSESVKKRTLVAFAEANAELTNLKTKLTEANSKETIVSAVFGRFINLNIVKESIQMRRIFSLMQMNEDEATQAPPPATDQNTKTDVGTQAGNIAQNPAQLSTGSAHKPVIRTRNTDVLNAIRRARLLKKSGK